jgi:uncharacterized RDD family membrane protein YckC
MFYDLFLIIPLVLLTSALLIAIHGPTDNAVVRSVPAWQQWIVTYLALVGFFGLFWRQKGQTLGMQAWRVKLVSRLDNARVPWTHVFIRISTAAAPVILSLLPFLYFNINNASVLVYVIAAIIAGMGFFWRWGNTERLYLHDQLSSTELRLAPPRTKK